ncbi:hypothetical protein MGN70_010569 [Eutypa lata]|nr:hypothetical protein MGN70_010569 [Eutypa lata]
MASIYANASLTIIAANGEDANYGLLGLPGPWCTRYGSFQKHFEYLEIKGVDLARGTVLP